MKLNLYQIALGATFLTFASAAPLRVVFVGSQNSGLKKAGSPLLFGHAAANAVAPKVSVIRVTSTTITATKYKPCMKSRIRAKAIKISNMFRQALGLPLIETHHHNKIAAKPDAEHATHGDHIRLIPTKVIKSGAMNAAAVGNDQDKVVIGEHHKHHHKHHRVMRESFLGRVHAALMALGPWEGRAVAFVLGCGIGVLLRMFWVMSVLSLRMMRRKPEEDGGYIAITENSAEDILVPPPHYTDEKVELTKTSEHA